VFVAETGKLGRQDGEGERKNMPEINWLQVAAGVVSGGAVGSLITNVVTVVRARRQPIGRRIEVLPVFHKNGHSSGLSAKIAVADSQGTVTFDNLFIAEIQMVNKGNVDLTEFEFGATFREGDTCVHVEVKSPDRHHLAIARIDARPRSPQGALDFQLRAYPSRPVARHAITPQAIWSIAT